MLTEVAKHLVLSLIDRVESKIVGATASVEITRHELDALRILSGSGETGSPAAADVPTLPLQQASKPHAPQINWADYKFDPVSDYRMCIDFGTAFSKVVLVGEKDDIRPLPIGRLAGSVAGSPFVLPSSVLVSGGRLYFGPQAEEKSRSEVVEHRRIDGLKQYLSKGEVTRIDDQKLAAEFADGCDWLTEGAVLRMYCGYLTALAEAACNNLHDGLHGRMIPRRFARPAWDQERSQNAKAFMVEVLETGCIIADQFKGKWKDGLPLDDVRALLNELATRTDGCVPPKVVLEDVLEATAAANAVTGGLEDIQGRRLLAVVDTGAGTTDFGVFVVRQAVDGSTGIAEIVACQQVLRQAGDTLDEALAQMLLEKISAAEGSDTYRREKVTIENRRRALKEELFGRGALVYRSTNDVDISIELEMFLACDAVKSFGEHLRKKFQASLAGISAETVAARGGQVQVIFTGGGATLPMVTSLIEPGLPLHPCRRVDVDQDWLSQIDDDLPVIFPQLSVAIGGAFPELPEQSPDLTDYAAPKNKNWTLSKFN